MLSETCDILPKLKTMSIEELNQLATEIRERLIAVVPQNGGHLASNLGVVEITLALYSLLDPFEDRIIWDVGHQCYVHKLLTGRADEFATIRCEGGLSGFPTRAESTADCFDTGHSSTSISAAIGFARARDLKGEHHRVVAIIGDGAFGNGMTFEALNDAGRLHNNIIIILNDNGMSIASNVGGMSKYLGRIRSRRSYVRMKRGVKKTLLRIPKLGRWIVRKIQRFKASLRLLLIPGEMFEELGCKYVGPVDGHQIEALQKAIEKAEYMDGPVIIHAITKKGRGYQPAEADPASYHGVSPTADTVSYPSYSANTGRVLTELAAQDDRIVAISAAMGAGTGLQIFEAQYPERYCDVGIAESHAITMACGMAAGGLKPYVCVYSTFMQRAYDQFLHDCALQSLPVTVLLDRAGVVGPDGKTHQGIYDLAFMRTMPGVVIAAPGCLEEHTAMIRLSAGSNVPFVIRYPAKDNSRLSADFVQQYPVQLGKGIALADEGQASVVFVSIGQMMTQALDAQRVLKESGIESGIFHARFVQPFDVEGLVAMLQKQPRLKLLVTLEDGIVEGGFGCRVLSVLQQQRNLPPVFVKMMGFPSEPILHGTIQQIYRRYSLTGTQIADTVRQLLNEER